MDSHTFMLDMLHSCTSVVCTYRCRVFLKNTLYGCCSLMIFVGKKSYKRHWTSFLKKCSFFFNFLFIYLFFLCTKGTLRSGRVEDNKIMFTRHLQLPQSYIQAILNIDKTDCMISLITMHILNARCICWQQ